MPAPGFAPKALGLHQTQSTHKATISMPIQSQPSTTGASPVMSTILLALFACGIMVILTIAGCRSKPIIFYKKNPESVAALIEESQNQVKSQSEPSPSKTPKPMASTNLLPSESHVSSQSIVLPATPLTHPLSQPHKKQRPKKESDNIIPSPPGNLPKTPNTLPLSPGEEQVKSATKRLKLKDVNVSIVPPVSTASATATLTRPSLSLQEAQDEIFDTRFTATPTHTEKEETSGSVGRVIRIDKPITGSGAGGPLLSPNLKPITNSVLSTAPH